MRPQVPDQGGQVVGQRVGAPEPSFAPARILADAGRYSDDIIGPPF